MGGRRFPFRCGGSVVLSSARRPGRTWSTGHPPWARRRRMSDRPALCLPPPPASGPRRASPVPRTAFWPFNAHYAGEFLGTRSRFRGAFRGLRLNLTGSALSGSAFRRIRVTTLARVSLPLQTGQLLAPFQGLCHSASTAGSRPTPGAVLPGTLASPRARLALAGCPELVARVAAIDHPLSGSSLQCVPEPAGRTEKCCYDNTEVPNLCRPWVCARSPVPCGRVYLQG